MEEQTIDGLPEDLVLQCLARLHYKDIHFASRVCRKWRRLLQAPDFYSLRKQLGSTNQLACFVQSPPPPSAGSNSSCEFNFVINVLDTVNREWNRLPPIPNFINGFSELTQIASLDRKLVVICKLFQNSHDLRTSLFVWDFGTERWRRGKDLPSICPFFSMVGFDSQIFIGLWKGNGTNSVWVYDVRKDEWTELPQMSQKRSQSHVLQVIGDELWVINGCRTKHVLLFEHNAEVYHLQTGKWRLVEWDFKHPNDSLCPYCCTMFELHESLKELPELNSKFIAHISQLQLGAQSLLLVTTINYDHCWEDFFFMRSQCGNFETIQPVSSEYSALVRSSCCVEV